MGDRAGRDGTTGADHSECNVPPGGSGSWIRMAAGDDPRGVSYRNHPGGNLFHNHGSRAYRSAVTNMRHDNCLCAQPAVRSDANTRKRAFVGTQNATLAITRMLPGPAQDLHTGANLAPFANVRMAENTVAANVDTPANSGVRCGKEGSKLNPGFGVARVECHPIECNPKIIPW